MARAGDFSQCRAMFLHKHVLESRLRRDMGRRFSRAGMISHLDALGLLNECTKFGRTGAAVVDSPVSDARLGSGFDRGTCSCH